MVFFPRHLEHRNTSTSERGVGLKVSNNKLFGAGVEGLNTTESGDSER